MYEREMHSIGKDSLKILPYDLFNAELYYPQSSENIATNEVVL